MSALDYAGIFAEVAEEIAREGDASDDTRNALDWHDGAARLIRRAWLGPRQSMRAAFVGLCAWSARAVAAIDRVSPRGAG